MVFMIHGGVLMNWKQLIGKMNFSVLRLPMICS